MIGICIELKIIVLGEKTHAQVYKHYIFFHICTSNSNFVYCVKQNTLVQAERDL